MWFALKDGELDKSTSGEVDNKWSIKEAMNIFDSELYYEAAIGSRKRCNISSIW